MGWVENKDLRLRAGQFITARIELPPGPDEAAIPASAVVDQGEDHFIFVQADAGDPRFAQRKVAVARRDATTVFVRTHPDATESQHGVQPLHVGEQVVSSGTLQLLAGLTQLETNRASN
jgi:cobalt-zinc-cadmium efflux system membrane fusion protein